MTDLQKKVVTAFAAATLLVNSALPAFAGTTLIISGNGSSSDNTADVNLNSTTTVVQSNEADIDNDVHVNADTGGNSADDNTGGEVDLETGDITTQVGISNAVNSNVASVEECDCEGDVDVLISGNGTHSDNKVELDKKSTTELFQNNEADVDNDVHVYADTGDNSADDNTGGSVTLKTGDIDVKSIEITNALNSNSARVGGGGGGAGDLSAWIIGNGSNSDNDIDLDLDRSVTLVQSNEADVENKVKVYADTGDNSADDNTGGEIDVETGDIDVKVALDTWANFNWAEVDCPCLFDDILAKIAENGTDSDNDIKAELGSDLAVFQGNCAEDNVEAGSLGGKHRRGHDCGIENDVKIDGDTGDNDTDDNTGGLDGADPSLSTGDIDADVQVDNAGNVNVYGDGFDLPEFPEFDFGFNWTFFWAWLHWTG
ncbi:hypothetical protein A2962_03765 [Candidatus Woesebacteria bacterium RIFCSPLOWO2_01_FULL_39_61]|uniref:Uncharacterized protein n=1 Tax=Candidatus Woesebacteria bacterium RIFCSPHIGHO2_02_FULL_39_13 TaxID=1802505 RepID=A0A1F7Z4I1_9BACT|nr:MAG: hypothetical protein A2692_03945 [Candidatus Woesebacteria bacterium RIFCSPHIGHO2_01_FULL_39_95]OGM33808.1 MAG: hypothetical protein A3D01_02455 [Candidatus Woesebacteria bacterium RIFCSPHIGHO2_02_FULL_39_13]OGM38969.1 MAG: hypothetical protein A3E13_04725 [Candidatus Woesebacteria bacterium RIFCSPHIGHO2_12_FULL_40_20]OGM65617.1 MAG: hypothetical protein A2962_03765 [Candidatus Woesebacteria bacterium RIFCSPLOWO2_01_FULL_39_61]